MLADCLEYSSLSQPLVTPLSMLPKNVQQEFSNKTVFDYGIGIKVNTFGFNTSFSVIPSALVIAYALAIATSGKANKILLAGFDGYAPGDLRNDETMSLFDQYIDTPDAIELYSITPTRYRLKTLSVYGPMKGII